MVVLSMLASLLGKETAPAWCVGAAVGVGGYAVLYTASRLAHRLGLVPNRVKNAYDGLKSDGERADWDSRLPSTVHAIAAVLGSYFPSLLSTAHTSNRVTHYDGRLFVDYGITGLGPEFFMGMFVTYLLSDLAVMAYYAFVKGEKAGNFWPSVAHHVFASISWASAINLGTVQWYGCFWMIAELSTVFVNIRHILHACGLKASSAYFYNGLAMTAAFFAVRVAPLPFTTYNFIATDAATIADHRGAPFAAFIAFCVLFNAGLQSFWFSLIVKGALKALRGGHSAKKAE